MNIQKLLEELDKLALPKDEYVLVGSAPLAIRKIREAKDLDIIISEKLWQELSQKYPIFEEYSVQKIKLVKGIDVLGKGSFYQDSSIAPVENMIKTADIISGYRFLNLELLKKFKAKMAREKDLKDIELINHYLKCSNDLNH